MTVHCSSTVSASVATLHAAPSVTLRFVPALTASLAPLRAAPSVTLHIPNGDMFIFFDEPHARIGKWWNLIHISHISSFEKPEFTGN